MSLSHHQKGLLIAVGDQHYDLPMKAIAIPADNARPCDAPFPYNGQASDVFSGFAPFRFSSRSIHVGREKKCVPTTALGRDGRGDLSIEKDKDVWRPEWRPHSLPYPAAEHFLFDSHGFEIPLDDEIRPPEIRHI